MTEQSRIDIKSLTYEEVLSFVESLGEKIKSQIQLFGVSNIREVIEIL